ncbi:hypothetical protein LSH36_576g03103 [Paralvinella palmiformis]|uniref:Uncharacterized protein n=1 Tax=Paralvinella palmiformis TaxID=53620 RepID=A0AAD9J6J8_9ANNE|nr:hypothetical protein LSH36_576g03103 [Paralvinella palmiformis]
MLFEEETFTECCGTLEKRRCCQQQEETSDINWLLIGMGLGVVIVIAITITGLLCYYNNCRLCQQNNNKRDIKKKPYNWRSTVSPVDRRLLLKTANYTVEQILNQIVISFQNAEYFIKFGDILRRRHPSLRSKVTNKDANQMGSSEQELCLYIDNELYVVIVEGKNKTSWLNANFQSICKNVHVTELSEDTGICLPRSRPLSPRLPTIGEEFYLEASHTVKRLVDGYEIEFLSMEYVMKLKTYIERDYPSAIWENSSLCHVIRLNIGQDRSVTLHMPRSGSLERKVWIYDTPYCTLWYNQDFRRLLTEAEEFLHQEKASKSLSHHWLSTVYISRRSYIGSTSAHRLHQPVVLHRLNVGPPSTSAGGPTSAQRRPTVYISRWWLDVILSNGPTSAQRR